jgi:hypothetical protein
MVPGPSLACHAQILSRLFVPLHCVKMKAQASAAHVAATGRADQVQTGSRSFPKKQYKLQIYIKLL